jgi:4-amino-4-deoxy-L-arabinose transferase-like glycosyltransferase
VTASTETADRQDEPGSGTDITTMADLQQGWWTGRRIVLAVIVAVAFVLRLAWLLYAKADPPVNSVTLGDQFWFWSYGNEIAAGRGYANYITHVPSAYYPVGYPALLALVFWICLHTPLTNDLMLAVGVMHVVFSTATVVLVYIVGRRVFNETVGLLAAAFMAVFPNAIYQVASLQLETTFVFLSMAALAIIVSHDWTGGLPSTRRLVAFGIVLGLSILVRPFSAWFLLGLFLAVVATRAGWRRALTVTLVPAAIVLAMHIPWIIRNELQMHAFIVTSTNTGDGLCLDRNSTATGAFRFATHDGCVDPNLPEVERDRGNTRKAISWVLHNPGREALQIVRRAKFEFAEDHDGMDAVLGLRSEPLLGPRVRSTLDSVSDWYFYLLLSAAAAGMPLLFHGSRGPERRLVLVAVLSLLMLPLLLFGNPRYHVPLLPFIALLAAAASYGFVTSVTQLRATRHPAR